MRSTTLALNLGTNKGLNSKFSGSGPHGSAETLRTHVAIIDLRPLRAAVRPEDWPRHRTKISSYAQHSARMLIGDSDTVSVHRCELCLVTMGDTTRPIASDTAAAIGHKIVHNLLGIQGVGRVTLQPRVFEIGALLASDIGMTESPSSAALPSGYPGAVNTAYNSPARPDRLARHRRLRGLYGADRPAEIEVSYQPIWSVKSRTVRTVSLTATVQRSGEPPAHGYDALPTTATPQDIAEYDLANLETCLLDLKAALDAEHDIRVLLPLHFETVGSYQGRSELQDIFDGLPSSVRQRLSIVLHDTPIGIPQGRLHQVYLTLKPLGRHIAVAVTPHTTTSEAMWSFAARARSVGMKSFAIALPDDPIGNIVDRAIAICSRATSMGFRVCTLNLRNGPIAHRLAAAGCAEFGGPLFGGPFRDLPKPFAVHSNVFERSR